MDLRYQREFAPRNYAEGMGQAVADRTINREVVDFNSPTKLNFTIPRDDGSSLEDQLDKFVRNSGAVWDGEYHVAHGNNETVDGHVIINGIVRRENWSEVASRVAMGNAMLADDKDDMEAMKWHLSRGTMLMSGRHLQHGDPNQKDRPMEVFTNCATAAMSYVLFYLLLNGSGVGRCYDDAMMAVDWNNMPIVVCVIDSTHPDVQSGEIRALEKSAAENLYKDRHIVVFDVPDSRGGWGEALEVMENMAYEGRHRDSVLLLEFSGVRARGCPIMGMQGRPASGPGPLMSAIENIARLRDAGMAPWKAAMYVDHYSAECVLVGGARRAARMSTKFWRDPGVLEFIQIKKGGQFLWSSNNSVTVDQEFWDLVRADHCPADLEKAKLYYHAKMVFQRVTWHAYHDGTGEPGFINVDKIKQDNTGVEDHGEDFLNTVNRDGLGKRSVALTLDLLERARSLDYSMITNPCGEISLFLMGGYCVIADTVPYHAEPAPGESDTDAMYFRLWDDDAEDAMRVTVRALMRVNNNMNSLYRNEVMRTQRIGVSMTGIHEYAFARFGYGWRELVNEQISIDFWRTMSRFKRAVQNEAKRYAQELGVPTPHTDTTIKPAGTTSKLFMLSEGAHLPAQREYLRWVQFRNDDPLIRQYEEQGYPVRTLSTYKGTTIVGFPTQPEICTLGMGDKLVTASEATPAEQYEWIRLLEKYWIRGVEEDGVTPLEETGNQVSYTLKYDPSVVGFEQFSKTVLENQPHVRCCSIMPGGVIDESAYEYLPEEPLTKAEYELTLASIRNDDAVTEDVDFTHVDCESGACPVDFNKEVLPAA